MWKNVGIVRSDQSVRRAISDCQLCADVLKNPPLSRLALETGNMLWASAALITSALARRESLGAHFRKDFPERERSQVPKHSALTREILSEYFSFDCAQT